MTGTDAVPETAVEMGVALRDGRTTATALATRSLERIGGLDPVVNAFVRVDADGALAAARRADAELAAGVDRGPLHGIPIAVKDIFDIEGTPTGSGTASTFATAGAASDAEVVGTLRTAGAVIVGKTTMHEFAYGATGDRSAQGASRNPHDPARMSGGSSGGSAVAVAAGMVPLALGTDTAGSVRVPAALCGVVGFKPAFDDLSTEGVHPLAPSLDHVGVFARTAADARLLYESLRGRRATLSPASAAEILWVAPEVFVPADPRVADVARAALSRAGAVVREDAAAALALRGRELFPVFTTLQSAEAYRVHAHHLDADESLIDAEVVARLRAGGAVGAADYARAEEDRERFRLVVDGLFESADVIAMPTVAATAPLIDQRTLRLAGEDVEVRATLLALTSPWNLTRTPALSVPAGLVDGLPVGVQLIARPGREALLFALAAAVEQHDPRTPEER